MSPQQIVIGRRLVVPPYPPGSFVYLVPRNTTSSVDKMQSYNSLYLRPNEEGGGHIGNNTNTMKQNSVHRVIGITKKPNPMTQIIINLINNQAKEEGQPEGIVFGHINIHATINDLDGSVVEHDP